MAEHNELGKKGEEIAQDYLARKGFKFLAKNWRYFRDEIDIVALYMGKIVFVEVKTRTTNMFGEPEEAVSKKKQKFLVRAADAYIQQNNRLEDARFDIVSVLLEEEKFHITHIEDAFYPTL
jgi:putative endonuclease